MRETQDTAVKEWRAAAKRYPYGSAQQITFDNMAWLIEHNQLWLAKPVLSASEQAKNFCANCSKNSRSQSEQKEAR